MKSIAKNTLGVLTAFCCLCAFAAQAILGAGSSYLAAANTYDGAVQTHAESTTRTNDAAITARHLLWKKGSADTGVALSGVADIPLGTIDNTETATGAIQAVLLLGRGPTKKMVASEAITAGEEVFTAASGKVQDRPSGSGTYYLLGIALTAAGADGDILEVNDCVPQKLVIA